jgi:hypothetical protein
VKPRVLGRRPGVVALVVIAIRCGGLHPTALVALGWGRRIGISTTRAAEGGGFFRPQLEEIPASYT